MLCHFLKHCCLDLLDGGSLKERSFRMHYAPQASSKCQTAYLLCAVIWGSRTLDGYLGAEVYVTGRIKRDYCVRCQERWVPPLSSRLCLELLILLTSQLDLREADFSNKILLNLTWLNLSLSGSLGNESFYSLMVNSRLWALMRGGWRWWNGIQRIFGEVESTVVLSMRSGVRLSRLTPRLHYHQLNYPEQ